MNNPEKYNDILSLTNPYFRELFVPSNVVAAPSNINKIDTRTR